MINKEGNVLYGYIKNIISLSDDKKKELVINKINEEKSDISNRQIELVPAINITIL